jgi:hypothetical protein
MMPKYRPARKKRDEPLFRVPQWLILIALVFAFAFAIRLASGDPLPYGIENLAASMLGLKH